MKNPASVRCPGGVSVLDPRVTMAGAGFSGSHQKRLVADNHPGVPIDNNYQTYKYDSFLLWFRSAVKVATRIRETVFLAFREPRRPERAATGWL